MSARFTSFERSEIVEKASRCLWTEEGKLALEYLRDQRKLSDETIRKFTLGYMPDFVRHNNPHVPQISGRIIIPLYDPSGNLIVVTTRAIREDDGLPKYWHETYEKSFYLYGLNVAIPSIRRWRFVVLVEGQFDVMQMHNHGMTNTVGVCSTNLSDVQVSMLHRYCDQVIILFDHDENRSGQKGTDKAMLRAYTPIVAAAEKTFMRYGYKFDHVEVPGLKDPDEYLKSCGMAGLRTLIKQKVQKMRQVYVP